MGTAAQLYSIQAIPLRLSRVPAGYLNTTRRLTHGPEHRPHSLHGAHQRSEDVFVEHIVATLDAAARDGEYDGVIVVLPPKALSHFRKVAKPELRKRIKHEICGEWSKLPVPDLERHLTAELS